MKLSACYIVGESEKDFEKSLQSLNNQVDEIIVVTTAADPNILAIAEKYQTHIYSYTWTEDFAAARNFAIEKANGDWIVFLDADEYMEGPSVESWRNLIEEKIKEKPEIEEIFIKLINIDIEKNNVITAEVFVPRFFVCRSDIRYHGRIHEELQCHNGKSLSSGFLLPEKIVLIHTGYSGKIGSKKAERNLKILLEDIKTMQNPAEHYMAIAEAYEGVGDFAKAIEYAKQDVMLNGRRSITYASRSYRVLFRLWKSMTRDMEDEILRIAEKSVMDFPELPEFWGQYAVYLANMFRYEEAIAALRKALECFKNYHSMEPSDFNKNGVKQSELLIDRWQENLALEKSLRISACVITKNEEEEIGRWIQVLKTCTDEQILVDTGSVDHTVEIAKAAGVKIYSYTWLNDFSKAKNYAIDQANGDWILFLDADEYFDEESCKNIRHVIAREHQRLGEVDAILCPWINIDVDQNDQEINRGIVLRVFRNKNYLRYAGKVHENIRNAHGQLNILVEKNFLKIYHTGYSHNRLQFKLQRNLNLLQEDIKNNGEKIQHYRYLLDCYMGLGEYDKAIKYAKLHISSAATSIGNESDVYRNLIIALIAVNADFEEIYLYSNEAIQKFPSIPDFYIYKGMVLLKSNNLLEAKTFLLRAYELCQQTDSDIFISTNYSQLLLGLYCNLSNVFYQLEDNDHAKYYLALALQTNRYSEDVFAQVFCLCEKKTKNETIEFLNCYYKQVKEDMKFIAEQWGRFRQDEVYTYYMEKFSHDGELKIDEPNKFGTLIRKNDIASFQENVKLVTDNLRLLLYCLFKEKEMLYLPAVKELVPEAFIFLLEKYHDFNKNADEANWDTYITILQMMKIFNDEDVLMKFCRLSSAFSEKHQQEIAEICCHDGFWREASELYKQILSVNEKPYAELYVKSGICFFHCDDKFAAKKYLKKALHLISDEKQKNELESYLAWLN